MKNVLQKSLRRLFCLVVMLGMFPVVSFGQNEIYDLAPFQSEYSIIRHYKEQVDVTYSMYTCNEAGFYYVDRQNNVAYRADLPCNYEIFDMRIYGEYLYFCGRKSLNAIVGWFKIDDVFLYGGNIHLMPIPHNGYDTIQDILKLKVFERNGDLHMVMIGYGTHSSSKINSSGYVVVDAYTNDFSSWYMKYVFDDSGDYAFDDIAVTDNYTIVTARNISTTDYLATNIFYYQLPILSGGFIFDLMPSTPSLYAPGYYTPNSLFYSKPGRNFLITEMSGDKFVTVCDAIVGTNSDETVVTYYQNPVSSPVVRYAFYPTTYNGYNEICYNRQQQSLYMPIFHTNVLECLKTPVMQLDVYKTRIGLIWMSIDTLDVGGDAVISGTEPLGGLTVAAKKVWTFDEVNLNSCMTFSQDGIRDMSGNQRDRRFYQRKNEDVFYDASFRPIVVNTGMPIICQ